MKYKDWLTGLENFIVANENGKMINNRKFVRTEGKVENNWEYRHHLDTCHETIDRLNKRQKVKKHHPFSWSCMNHHLSYF